MVETERPHCSGGIELTCRWTYLPLKSLCLKCKLTLKWWQKPSLADDSFCSGHLLNNFSPHICGDLEASPVIGSDGHNPMCVAWKVADGASMAEILFPFSHMSPPRSGFSHQVHPCGNSQSLSTDFLVQHHVSCPNPFVLCYLSEVHPYSLHERLMSAESCR